MKSFVEKEYWDSIHSRSSNAENRHLFGAKEWLKKRTRDYSNETLSKLYSRFLPKSQDFKIIEIGCAPGKYLINFHKDFGYQLYGVEYSDAGVELAKDNLKKNHLSPDSIIKADFFDSNFQKKYRESFDVVFSRGFVEHYDNVEKVIACHLNLAKKDGFLVVSIPNLAGINKVLAGLFNSDSLVLHNTFIMNKDVFKSLFSEEKIKCLYCDYVGIFSFGLFNTNYKWKYIIWRMLLILQRPFDFLLHIFFKNSNFKCKYTSPYLLFIGQKR